MGMTWSPDALTAAAMLSKGVDRDLYAIALTRGERTAVLACLEDPPDGLVELRGTLLRDSPLAELRLRVVDRFANRRVVRRAFPSPELLSRFEQ